MPRGALDIQPLRTSAEFRGLWIGTSLSAIGAQLAVVAVLYQVWQLTGSAAWVGVIGIAKAVPMIVFGLVGGALADAVDRRRLVLVSTLAQLLAAGGLAAQALGGVGSLWLVLGLVAVQSAAGAAGAPARRSFVPRLLPTEQVPAGVALNHLSFQISMLVGPAAAGLLAAHAGVGVCYLLDALSSGAAAIAVLRLPPLRPLGSIAPPGLAATIAGWRFIARRPVLGGALLTDVLATVLSMPVALFPALADERYGGGPQLLGLFLTAIAVGGIGAGVASGFVTGATRPGLVMLCSAAIWGLGLAGVGLASSSWVALACLVVAGAADTVSVISRGSIVQLATPDSYRGRVGAAEHVVGVAGPDVGNFRAGLVAGATSPTFALVSGGLVCAAGVAILALGNRPLRRFSPTMAWSPPTRG